MCVCVMREAFNATQGWFSPLHLRSLLSTYSTHCDYVRNIKHNLVKHRARISSHRRDGGILLWDDMQARSTIYHSSVWISSSFNSMMRFVLCELSSLCTHKIYRLCFFILYYNIIFSVNPFMFKACICLLSSLFYFHVVVFFHDHVIFLNLI